MKKREESLPAEWESVNSNAQKDGRRKGPMTLKSERAAFMSEKKME